MHFKREISPKDAHNLATFSQNQGTFFQFSRKGRGDLPPPPSSNTPVVTRACRILLLPKFTIMKLKTDVFSIFAIFL